METQNSEATLYFPARTETLNNRVVRSPSAHRRFGCKEVPAVTRAELKRRNHGDMPGKKRLATRKRTPLNPGAADEDKGVDSPPLVYMSALFLMSPYPVTAATHGSIGWALATLAIVIVLTAMLMVGIAISV
jgi:hypothetical protein